MLGGGGGEGGGGDGGGGGGDGEFSISGSANIRFASNCSKSCSLNSPPESTCDGELLPAQSEWGKNGALSGKPSSIPGPHGTPLRGGTVQVGSS